MCAHKGALAGVLECVGHFRWERSGRALGYRSVARESCVNLLRWKPTGRSSNTLEIAFKSQN